MASDAQALFAMPADADSTRWLGADAVTAIAHAQGLIDTFAQWRTA